MSEQNLCPVCGHVVDMSAEILRNIERVVAWRDQTHGDDDGVAIYDACIVYLRGLPAYTNRNDL